MLSGELRSDIDQVWDQVWSSGVSNPLTCVDYMSLLLAAPKTRVSTLLETALAHGDAPKVLSALQSIRTQTGLGSDALFQSNLLVNDLSTVKASYNVLRDLDISDRNRDLVGDVFEYVLSKLSTAGQFGQFRTPRHIIQFIVDIVNPRPGETVLDPACGTGGFLIAAAEKLRQSKQSTRTRLIGYEIDSSIAQLARSNVFLHDMDHAVVDVRDSLGDGETKADVILANPPFAGVVSPERVTRYSCGSSRTELLFLEYMMGILRKSGRAGVVVPFGVLTSNNAPSIFIRKELVERHGLTAVVELPPGVFRPYTDVRTGLLFWNPGNSGDEVLLAKVNSDGFTLDDRRSPSQANDLPRIKDILATNHVGRSKLAVRVSKRDLRSDNYVLSPSRYLESQTRKMRRSRSVQEVSAEMSSTLKEMVTLVRSMEEVDE